MNSLVPESPLFVLVDDQMHSARLMWRTLSGIDPTITFRWLGNAGRGARLLADIFDGVASRTPQLIIIDLKAHSRATAEFVATIAATADLLDIPIAAMSPSLEPREREVLLASGADGVFERHGNLTTYTEEVRQLAAFWRHARAPKKIRA